MSAERNLGCPHGEEPAFCSTCTMAAVGRWKARAEAAERERDELVATVAHLQGEAGRESCAELAMRAIKAEARVVELEGALRELWRYCSHRPSCSAAKFPGVKMNEMCSCGLDAALAGKEGT